MSNILNFGGNFSRILAESFSSQHQPKLDGCIVLNEQNTVFARSGPLYVICLSLGPPESSTQTASRSLHPFLQGSVGDRQTDRRRYSVGNNWRQLLT